jgi:hypothetical protein
MTGAVVTINLPGDARKNNDRMLRAVTEDTRVETIRGVVTAMMHKPSDYVIGQKTAKPSWRTKAYRPDEEAVPAIEVDATVEAAFT